ncbi:MAG: hypothetical protein GY725_18310 [bacterium]|nr:hypothetical protein [bacterium]
MAGPVHEIIFEAETAAGKAFDVGLLLAILGSVLAVSLESVEWIDDRFHTPLRIAEWVESGFDNIPRGMYWAVVTVTTVGYGILAVPTGIFSFELVQATRAVTTQACGNCGSEGHDPEAVYCKFRGAPL